MREEERERLRAARGQTSAANRSIEGWRRPRRYRTNERWFSLANGAKSAANDYHCGPINYRYYEVARKCNCTRVQTTSFEVRGGCWWGTSAHWEKSGK
eukprot:scaffold1077_cov253-Pinguiococcus_pyrenoidosus.AAC.9